jgi:hypothetical protein
MTASATRRQNSESADGEDLRRITFSDSIR